MELTELEKAVQELDAVTEPPAEEKAEITIIGRLSKAMEGLTGLLKKSAVEKETPATAEKEPEKETPLTKAQPATSEKDIEVDVTAAFEDLRVTLAKSVATVGTSVETMGADMGHIAEAVLVLCKSQKALHEMIAASPKSLPMLGVITNGKGRENGTDGEQQPTFNKSATRLALTRAVREGKVETQFLGMFDTHPQEVLKLIPEDVAKSYGIPKSMH